MPPREEILAGLGAAANDGVVVAVLWHVLVAIALVARASGWQPSRRQASFLFAAPLASVSVASIAIGNPFNGAVFAALAIALGAIGVRSPQGKLPSVHSAPELLGMLMVTFAWVYPHFLVGSPLRYLYAAPIGLVPCPTLALLVGFALLGGGWHYRRSAWVLAAAGLFYGLVGVFRLGVMLDVPLIVGALALAWFTESRRYRRAIHTRFSH